MSLPDAIPALVLALPLMGGVAGGPAPMDQAADRAAGRAADRATPILLEAADDGEHDIDRLARRLGSLSSDVVPELFGILASGEIDDPELSRPIELDAVLRAAVLQSFGRHSPAAVRALLGDLAAEAAGGLLSEDARTAALAVLGEMGRADDVRTLLRIATPHDPGGAVSRTSRTLVTDALARTLARDPRSIWDLSSSYEEVHPGLQASILAAIGMARPPEGLQVLTDLLGRTPAMDPLVLAEIGQFAESVGGRIDPMVLATVRGYLTRADPRLVRGAALAVRKLDDTPAAPELIRLLRHSDPNVRASSDLALQRIAGRDLRADADRWEKWYSDELAWREERGGHNLADLKSGHKAVVASALNEIARHRLFRHEFEGALADLLSTEDRGLVVLTCGVIGKLGARQAVPALRALREDPDGTLSTAAEGALRALLGPAHGASPPVVQH